MATPIPIPIVPNDSLSLSESFQKPPLPRDCTFSESDWRALAPHWYPIAFFDEVKDKPHAARLLDERVVVYRLSDGKIAAAKDICYHRGAPLSLGSVAGDEIICKYHGLRYNASGQCTCIPAHPNGAISPRLRRLSRFAATSLKMRQRRQRWISIIRCLRKIGPLWNNNIRKTCLSRAMLTTADQLLDRAHFDASRACTGNP